MSLFVLLSPPSFFFPLFLPPIYSLDILLGSIPMEDPRDSKKNNTVSFLGVFLRYAGLSLLWPLPLQSTGSGLAGSAAMAHGPSCSTACGIFPDLSLIHI